MSLAIGQVINGKYRVIRLVGEGGMGTVYEAVHEGLHARVALKALHDGLASTGLGPRFLQEARAAAKIQSPHVVRVSDVDQTEDGVPFMVLEYLEGRTLQALYEHLYQQGERLPYADALDFAVQICEGVEAAHAAGIVHRDLKPDNVMITAGPRGVPLLKLLDFGIAKLEDKSDPRSVRTRAGVVMGTPEYMAPEQAYAAETADARADVFSLGVMIFEMLAGRRPVAGDEPQEIAVAYLTGEVAQLRDLAPDVPADISAAVHRAMAAKPPDRLASVRELREVIEPHAGALRPPQASRASATPSTSKGGTVAMASTPGVSMAGVQVSQASQASQASLASRPIPETRSDGAGPLPPVTPAGATSTPPATAMVLDEPTKQSAADVGGRVHESRVSVPVMTAPPASVQQWPYGAGSVVTGAPAAAAQRRGPSLGVIAGIVIGLFVVLGGVAVWAVYYFTDVFDDPAPVKKPPPKAVPKVAPQAKPAPHR